MNDMPRAMSGALQSAIDEMPTNMKIMTADSWRSQALEPGVPPEYVRLWNGLARELDISALADVQARVTGEVS